MLAIVVDVGSRKCGISSELFDPSVFEAHRPQAEAFAKFHRLPALPARSKAARESHLRQNGGVACGSVAVVERELLVAMDFIAGCIDGEFQNLCRFFACLMNAVIKSFCKAPNPASFTEFSQRRVWVEMRVGLILA
ncbi:MAG: hypothetical protein R3D26_04480 [Cyanobacteriota/Melainabacteria group bacterium]